MLFTCRSPCRGRHVLFLSKDDEQEDGGDDDEDGATETTGDEECSSKQGKDGDGKDKDVDRWDESDEGSQCDPSEALEEAWRLRTASLWGLKQYLNLRHRSRTNSPSSQEGHKVSSRGTHRWPLASIFRRFAATARRQRPEATEETTPSPLERTRSMAHRHCLRIRASQARGILTSHPSVNQVFASGKMSDTERDTTHKSVVVNNNNNNNNNNSNSDASTQTDDESGLETCFLGPPRRAPLFTIRLLDTWRRRKKVPFASTEARARTPLTELHRHHQQLHQQQQHHHRQQQEQSSLRLLELPAQHQPLLHRYGLSQFVLVVDEQLPTETSPSSIPVPPRSMMRKQRPTKSVSTHKKSVKFQETPRDVRRKPRWIDQLLN